MEPEEVDKLFNERLGRMAPTPPTNLWNRLQNRMEAELPQAQQPEEKRKFGWLYYSIAAAITLLLAVGVVLRYNQPQTITEQPIAKVDVAEQNTPTTDATEIPEAAAKQSIAAVTESKEIKEATEQQVVGGDEKNVEKKATRPAAKAEPRWIRVEPGNQQRTMLAKNTEPAVTDIKPEQVTAMQTPVSFASANSAAPVEIIIKRSVSQDEEVLASAAEPEESSSFERKQKLAKNIFKQVKNLSNGEKVNMSDLGLNADKIALETKIGKQRISKVINL